MVGEERKGARGEKGEGKGRVILVLLFPHFEPWKTVAEERSLLNKIWQRKHG